MSAPKKVVITGATGRIGYHLLFLIAQGLLLGADQPVILSILEKESNQQKCRGIQMELEDSLFPLLRSVHYTCDLDEAFSNADYIFFCGAKTCHDPKMRSLVQEENWKALTLQGESINRVCSSETLSLMIANPCNTNTLALIKAAPNIPSMNFHSMMRLDLNRARQLLAEKVQCLSLDVEDLLIWGNHSHTVVPDWSHVKVKASPIHSQVDHHWLLSDFIQTVQKRGMAITAHLGLSSCASAAYAAIGAMKDLIVPTTQRSFFCTGMYSYSNPFGFDPDLVFGLPCRTISRGIYEICKDYSPPSFLRELIKQSEVELLEERARLKK